MIILAAGAIIGLAIAGARFSTEFVLWFLLVAASVDRLAAVLNTPRAAAPRTPPPPLERD